MERRWNVGDLTDEQQSVLLQTYGPQPKRNRGYAVNQILFVRELTEHERRIFANQSFMSPNFLTQVLYKLRGNFTPMRFTRMLHERLIKSEILRTNYCPMRQGTLAVVFAERRELPHVVYRNLAQMDAEELDSTLGKVMEADMREGIDLRHGNILRFSVFHTGTDEYAVLVTMAQVVLDRVDVRGMFRELLNRPPLPERRKIVPEYMVSQRSRMEASMRDYWTRMLSELPSVPLLPYVQRSKTSAARCQLAYRRRIPADIMSDLRERAKSNRMMLMAMLQTAWGIVLQEHNDSRDVFFCILVPDRKEMGSDEAMSGAGLNMMPVRFKASDASDVQRTVSQQFQQLMVSQPYSCFDWESMQGLTGYREKLFDHFLSFCDFTAEEQSYSEVEATPEGAFVMRNSWDALGSRLGIYFRYEEQCVSFSIMYDEKQFAPMGGMLLANRYLLVLQQMLTDWNLSFGAFMERLRQRVDSDGKTEVECRPENTAARIQDTLSRIKLLQEAEEGIVQMFRQHARMVTCFEGDRISGTILEENLVFVASGRLSRNMDAGDGWYNALDILKEGDWVNDTVMLIDKRVHFSAEVLTEEAEILLYPVSAMNTLMKSHPRFGKNIVHHLARQLEKYRRLWAQA